MKILGIETSCDETAAAVVEVTQGRFSVLSNVVASQVKTHAKTGGVVPEVAAREHVEKIIPVARKALLARATLSDAQAVARHSVSRRQVDVIAVTTGPGLATSLSVGMETARTLAYVWKKPIVAVNHLAGHIYANWLTTEPQTQPHEMARSRHFVRPYQIEFPILCLIVSGGHTELVLMKKHLDFKVIGSTRDDAAGEAFDKVAKMLGLGYPGGPIISKLAEKGDSCAIPFPRPMIDSPNFDFSFSGLKTAVLYWTRDHKFSVNDLCASFEQAVVEVLVAKTIRAAKKYKVQTILLGGGVAANNRLRKQLANAVNRELLTVNCVLPPIEYTTDNAAMIAVAGYFMARAKQFISWQKLDIDPNWGLDQNMRLISR